MIIFKVSKKKNPIPLKIYFSYPPIDKRKFFVFFQFSLIFWNRCIWNPFSKCYNRTRRFTYDLTRNVDHFKKFAKTFILLQLLVFSYYHVSPYTCLPRTQKYQVFLFNFFLDAAFLVLVFQSIYCSSKLIVNIFIK